MLNQITGLWIVLVLLIFQGTGSKWIEINKATGRNEDVEIKVKELQHQIYLFIYVVNMYLSVVRLNYEKLVKMLREFRDLLLNWKKEQRKTCQILV